MGRVPFTPGQRLGRSFRDYALRDGKAGGPAALMGPLLRRLRRRLSDAGRERLTPRSTPVPSARLIEEPRPPGPRGLPLVGIMPFLAQDRLQTIGDLFRSFGDTVGLGRQPGFGDVTLTCNPDLAHDVLNVQASHFVKSPNYRKLALLTGDGLLSLEGQTWKAHRRVVAPRFHPTVLAGMVPQINRVLDEHVGQRADRSGAQTFDIAREMQHLALEIVCSVLLGKWASAREQDALRGELQTSLQCMEQHFYETPVLSWLPTHRAVLKRLRASRSTIDDVVGAIYDRARLAPRVEGDWLSDIIHGAEREALEWDGGESQGQKTFSRADVCSAFKTLVFAGHETTANALAWFWWCWMHESDGAVRARVLQEVDAAPAHPNAADLRKMPMLRACLEETLRLFPPVPALARQAIRPVRVGSVPLQAGQIVIVSLLHLHRDPQLWSDPETWDPQRFFGHSPRTDIPSWLPFGAGPRVCVGANFALTEMMLVVSRYLKQWTVVAGSECAALQESRSPRRKPDRPRLRSALTLSPEGGVVACVRLRRAGDTSAASHDVSQQADRDTKERNKHG